jgi:hypothetical protein
MDKIFNNYQYHIPHTGRIAHGTLKQVFFIQQRNLAMTNMFETEQEETFTTLYTMMGRLEVIKPVLLFDGVNTEGELATHIGYITYDPVVFALNKNTLFVTVEYNNQYVGDTNIQFKLIEKTNYFEESKFILLYLKETGRVTQTATQG